MKNWTIKLFLAVFCFVFLTGTALAGEIKISVAASLTDAVTDISKEFTKKNPGVSFQRNFASSGALAKQIANGAPCDVYFSANVEWMDFLKEKNLVDARYVSTFAFNEVVFVGKPGLKVSGMQDVVKLGKVAIGSPKSVPAGQYAMEAIKSAGLEKQLEKKLVMARDVRECLMYAERGEVDGSFVYKTDAMMAKNVKILFAVPQKYYSRVTYPVALTAAGSKNAEAVAFYNFLKTADVKKILAKYGFAVK